MRLDGIDNIGAKSFRIRLGPFCPEDAIGILAFDSNMCTMRSGADTINTIANRKVEHGVEDKEDREFFHGRPY